MPPPVWLSYATYVAEVVTLLLTCGYVGLQSLPYSSNGFCLPSLCTHWQCTCYDTFFLAFMASVVMQQHCSLQAVAMLAALLAHVGGHLFLYLQTRDMSLTEANHYRHWSFTLVLVLINGGYCLPRVLLYGPSNTAKRVGNGCAAASLGILGLMGVAAAELLYCPVMGKVGGHLLYDVGISLVVWWHYVETQSQKPLKRDDCQCIGHPC